MLQDFASMDRACLTAFGRDIVFLPKSGGQAQVRAIFERTVQAEDASPGVYAVMFVRPADLRSAPVRGDSVLVDGVVYKIFDIEADSSGGAVLKLRKAD